MFSIYLRIVSYLRQYCSHVSNFLRFGRADEGWFLVFGVPNAKYLAFDTPDESALIVFSSYVYTHNNYQTPKTPISIQFPYLTRYAALSS